MTFLLPCLAVFQSCEMKKLSPRRFTVLPFPFCVSKPWTSTLASTPQGGSRMFFRKGCTCLLLYFNTNKAHSFFFVFAEYQLRTPCTLTLDPPLLRKWIVSIEQYVVRSVLVRNSAVSSSDSRERHFAIKTYEKGLGLFWLFNISSHFIIVMPSMNSNFSRNPSNVIFLPYFIFSC